MGVVYLARDLELDRKVALKVLAPKLLDDPTARGRFQMEIQSAVAIEHPHVVPVYDAGYDGRHFYIAMRFVDGPDLAKVLQAQGGLHEARAMRLLGQLASALHAVHKAGLVHRDVKPHNVLIWSADEHDEHALLTDFGIAKALADTGSITSGGPIGTPAYMAPEICSWQPATPASDQYSLACVAFEMLSGQRPFDEDGMDVREAHIAADPRPLSDCAPGIQPAICTAIDRALEKDPANRFPDVVAFIRATGTAGQSFARSQKISEAIKQADDTSDAISTLHTEHGLSDGTIAEITDLDRTEVVRRRRRAARRLLVGGSRSPRNRPRA